MRKRKEEEHARIKLLSPSLRMLQSLPSGMKVRGSFECTLTNLNPMTLPDRLQVDGNLILSYCRNIVELPEGLVVSGLLWVNGTGLREINERVIIGGGINLMASNVSKLRDGLSVNGSLNLSYCNLLFELPKRLVVRDYLHLSGCENIKDIPYDTKAMTIDYNSNTGFSRDNEKLDELKYRFGSRLERIYT